MVRMGRDRGRANGESGRWLDAAPEALRLSGRCGQIEGVLNLSPAPYGRPLLAQAGSSPRGTRFAARHADQVFTVQSDIAEARAFRIKVRRFAAEAGRSLDAIQVLPGIVPFGAATSGEAEAALTDVTRRIGMTHIVPKLERFTGPDLGAVDPDAPLHTGRTTCPRTPSATPALVC